ncbi:MAG: type I-MYXAN CRISPR-associated Cas8a1/Cmx1 [Vicinamibacterales bacterium]
MATVAKPPAPEHLTMKLFAPGMTAMHRAGLGGLACTLKAMERQYEADLLRANKLPGPLVDGLYPWDISDDTVTLRFGKPTHARDYLKKLFAFAFSITRSGLIYLPGQHHSQPSDAILAALQSGFTLTFLQHGRVRALAKDVTTVSYDFAGDGVPSLVLEYKKCSGFKHQAGWEELVKKDGSLVVDVIKVDGPISPGTVIRHVAFTSQTGAEDPAERMLPLYFSMVGCLSLPVNRGVAALIVPEVEDLLEFLYDRPAMTPSSAMDCQIANAADAAFRAQVRVRESGTRKAETRQRARKSMAGSTIPACYAMTFMPTPWASQQKSRVATIHVSSGDDAVLDRYQLALVHLAPRIVTTTVRESAGRGRQKTTTERQESFRSDSVVRPLIAENLALGIKWYADFVNLMTKKNPATDKPYRDHLHFEIKGLHAMITETKMWDQDGEQLVVEAIHQAMRQRMAQIRSETEGDTSKGLTQATKNRWDRFRERLRLSLCGSKKEDDVRFALMDLFSRAGNIPALRGGWQHVLPVIRRDWRLSRDLGLLALASYAGRGDAGTTDQP